MAGRSMGAPAAAEQAVARSEHAANVLRMRRLSAVAIVAWLAFGGVDVFITQFVEPGRLWFYLACRGIGLLLIVPVAIRFHVKPMPSPLAFRILELGTTFSLCSLITLSSLEFRGIETPLILGVVTCVLGRGVFISEHWRKALLPAAVMFASYPLTLVAMAFVWPSIAAQFQDRAALAAFALNLMFLGGVVLLAMLGGHVGWTLRRQLFETRSLGRYRLEKRIGKGGMGEVWKAHDKTLKREVAIKILNAEKEGLDERAVHRFEREVRATSELTHPHTIRVFDVGSTEDGLFYYAMELLEGEDLEQVGGPIDARRAVHLVWQASRALAEAHARGLVHRDLKPANLFVTRLGGESDFVKVLDFGLVALSEERGGPTLTEDGWAVGTPEYIPPEVVAGKKADPRADVYALGVVLYKLLSGVTPFERGELRASLHAALHETPVAPSQKTTAPIPDAVDRVVLRCLEKDPAARYPDAHALSLALESALRQEPVDHGFDDQATEVDERPPSFLR